MKSGGHSNQPPPGSSGFGSANAPPIPGINNVQQQPYHYGGGPSGFAGDGRPQGQMPFGNGHQVSPGGMVPPVGGFMHPGMVSPPVIPGGRGRGRGPPFMGGRMVGARFCAVKLRGLPFGVKEYEIGMFLQVEPVDVVIVLRNGKPNGDAFVILSHPSELDVALRKNKAYLGTRYIEVFEAKKLDYYRAIVDTFSESFSRGSHQKRSRSKSPHHQVGEKKKFRKRNQQQEEDPCVSKTPIVKLRGLPFSAGQEKVLEFFQDVVEVPSVDKVLIATGSGKRPTGMAFVEFGSVELAQKALKKHKESMGNRYIEVFPATEDDRARYLPVS